MILASPKKLKQFSRKCRKLDFKQLSDYEAHLWFMAKSYLEGRSSKNNGYVYYVGYRALNQVARRILKAGMYRKQPISLLSKIKKSHYEMIKNLRTATREGNKSAIRNYQTLILLDDLLLTKACELSGETN